MGYIGAGISRFNTADSLTVTGDVTASGTVLPTGDTAAGDAAAVGFTSAEGLILTGQGSSSDLTIKNDADATVFSVPTGQQKILFPDNARALFGDGSDLQIYHDGNNSAILENGTGDFWIGGDNALNITKASFGEYKARFVSDGAVELYYDNSKKLETTSSGVSVTGGVVASGGLSVDSYADPSNNYITLRPSFAPSASGGVGFAARDHDGANNDGLGIYGHDGISFTTGGSERARLDSSGNLLVGKTALGTANDGLQVKPAGELVVTRDGNHSLILNRKSSDGDIALFQKGGTTVCSIGVMNGNNPYIANDADNSGIQFGSGSITPSYDGAGQNNSVDLGSSSTRFKDGYFNNGITARYHYNIDDPDTYFDFATGNNIKVFNGGSEKFRFGSDGAFSVGVTSTSSPGAGNTATGCTLRGAIGDAFFSRSNGTAGYFNVNQDDNVIAVLRSGTQVGGINVTTSGTTFATTSDIRLKQNIEPLAATDKLMAMNPVSYNWKADPDGPRSMGFIAQEMQEVMPEAVSTGDDDDAMMSMDYGRITPILVSALQDAHRKIDELAVEIAELKAS